MQIYCLGSVGQKFEMGLAGLKSKYFMAAFLLGGYRGASVSLPFPMFRGCAHSLVMAPFHLQRQKWLVESLLGCITLKLTPSLIRTFKIILGPPASHRRIAPLQDPELNHTCTASLSCYMRLYVIWELECRYLCGIVISPTATSIVYLSPLTSLYLLYLILHLMFLLFPSSPCG